MNYLGVFCLAVNLNSVFSLKASTFSQEQVAISQLYKVHFTENSKTCEIVNFGEHQKVIEEVLKSNSDSTTVQVTNRIAEFKTPTFLSFDSTSNLKSSINQISWPTSYVQFNFHHLIVVPNITIDDLTQTFQNGDGYAIDNVNFLVRNGNRLELVTSFMFTEDKCNTTQFRTINRFDEKKMKWEKADFFPEKYRNFHGCPVTIGFDKSLGPQRSAWFFRSAVSTVLNFKYVAKGYRSSEDLASIQYDFLLDIQHKLDFSTGGFSFSTMTVLLAVPPGTPYSYFEKMQLPFDDGTWIAIGVTFLFVFTTITVVQLCPRKYRNFILGRNVSTPTLNFVNTFLTGGQHQLPGRNFARFNLMLFIIWSLIIRTCYQSKLFEFLQKDMRKPSATTFDELYKQNFTFLAEQECSFIDKTLSEMGLPKFNCETFDGIELFPDLYNIVTEPENKKFAILPWLAFVDMMHRDYVDGVASIELTSDVVYTRPISFRYNPDKPFVKKFDEVTMRAVDAGLTNYILKTYYDTFRKKLANVGPQILKMEHLEAGFLVCAAVGALSLVVFIFEHVVKAFEVRCTSGAST